MLKAQKDAAPQKPSKFQWFILTLPCNEGRVGIVEADYNHITISNNLNKTYHGSWVWPVNSLAIQFESCCDLQVYHRLMIYTTLSRSMSDAMNMEPVADSQLFSICRTDKLMIICTTIGIVTASVATACFIVFWCNPTTMPCCKKL